MIGPITTNTLGNDMEAAVSEDTYYYASPRRWLKVRRPALPLFNDFDRIGACTEAIKRELIGNLQAGLANLIACDPTVPDAIQQASPVALLLACFSKPYGLVYYFNRAEIARYADFVEERTEELGRLDAALRASGTHIRLLNYAVAKFIYDRKRAGHLRESKLRLPAYSFWSASATEIFVNGDEVFDDPDAALQRSEPLYDLHDFSHYTCASLSGSLYGAKRFGGFESLSPHYQNLLTCEKFNDPTAYCFTDNVLFRNVSLKLFDSAWDRGLAEPEIEQKIEQRVTQYLQGAKNDRGTDALGVGYPEKPVSERELCVLVQNKCYEHPASVMEEMLFIRANRDPQRDPLAGLRTVEFFRHCRNKALYYSEIRNFVRHQAIRNAYGTVAASGAAQNAKSALCLAFLHSDQRTIEAQGDLFAAVS